ncbi:hypothetical protein [Tenacibaculum sp. nBUS_03]|uniref:hypothetical protein n=1 Tax=Tenacibaculum sp. nBUS_03 TaxID=3395320 RepID=UPI003EBAF137
MKAETAYNVIQALPKEELPRLYKMLGVNVPSEKRVRARKKKQPLITNAEAYEYVLRIFDGRNKRALKG